MADPQLMAALDSILRRLDALENGQATLGRIEVPSPVTIASLQSQINTINTHLGTLDATDATYLTFFTGINATDTTQNTNISDLQTRMAAQEVVTPQARVYRSTNQTISPGSLTPISFDGEIWDNDNVHSPSSNPTRLTAITSGLYWISGGIAYATAATSPAAYLKVNGSTYIYGDGTLLNPGAFWPLSAGDYVELWVSHSSAGSRDVVSSGNTTPHLGMSRLK